jgi:hypothetical protein
MILNDARWVTAEMFFDAPTTVAFSSRTITLELDDVMCREIDGIGVIENHAVDQTAPLDDHEWAPGVGRAGMPSAAP